MALLAHVAGIPVEETVLALGPALLGLAGLAASHGRARLGVRRTARAASRDGRGGLRGGR